ncbi:HIT family protein [Bacillus sp. HNG]|uniref:HIT family protein n=1 Tax=Bacillus sp. HNG TaxID=2293325 RepID=UPI000E2EA934|nr:HIT family protein [Bacillus sp. HNG]RFB17434.1 HIT family protein [Bacillus sp. HNG]
MSKECFYCEKDKRLSDLMVEICELRTSTFYLNKDQTHVGRSIVTFKQHRKEIFELSTEELHHFIEDVSSAAKSLQKAFNPDKINYGIYGDIVSHLHVHIVPKYKNGTDWGEAFENNPLSKKMEAPNKYESLIEQIKMYVNRGEKYEIC